MLQNAGQIFSDAEIYNYRGFLNVSVDMESSTLRYKIYGATEEQALANADAVKDLVRDTMPEISRLICEHSIALLNERIALQSDPELAVMHADFETSMSETTTNLSAAMDLMETLESPEVETPSPAVAVPPKKALYSTMATESPARAAVTAAATPVVEPPATTRSYMPAIGIVSPCVTRRPSSVARTRKPANAPPAATVAMNCRLLVILSHCSRFRCPQ